MKKIKHLYLKSRSYFVSHQAHFLFLLVALSLLYFLSKIPYINIFLSDGGIVIVFWIITLIILKLNEKVTFIFALFFLFISSLVFILKNKSLTELLGDVSYFLLVVGFVQSFWKYLKGIGNENKK